MRITSKNKRLYCIVTLVLIAMIMFPLVVSNLAYATTVNVLDGQVSITDSANSNTVSGGTVTIKAAGNLFGKKTNNITITNETSNTAELSFAYSADKASSFTIAGASAATSGSYTVILDAGASLAIVLVSNSGFSNTTATLTLSNFSLKAAASSSNVTIQFDGALGSVTAAGAAVEPSVTLEVSLTDGVALVASPNSGVSFLGWVNAADGSVLSTSTSYTLKPASDMIVKAAFVKDGFTPWFAVGAASQKSVSSGLLGMSKLYYYTVGTTYLFDDLNAAAQKAASDGTNKIVVLMNSGTLPAGTYTIPSGVTLLIPFDDANTMYTTQVQNTGTYTKPTAYRTLTMADGANLIINGSMSLSAKQRYAAGNKTDGGSPTGPCSFINMQGSSSITVNNGGALYAYSFITGSGTVTANSGSSVYECFQFMDFRGGTQSTDMENGVFPLSQYYVQNIEVPMTIHSGAKEYAYTTIYMSSTDFGSSINFIGSSGCMFNLTSGYVIKQYNGAEDRLEIELYGDMTVSSINMSVGTSSINSKNYELPINGNITLSVCDTSKVSIGQDLALLPGAEIIIDDGASVTLNNGINVYIYDLDQWGTFCGAGSKTVIPITYAPGKTYNRTANDLVDAKIVVNGTLDASAGYLYTTKGGANIISEGTGVVKMMAGTQTITYQLVQGTGYTEIPITSAKLKNGDDSYVDTSSATSVTTYAYCAEHMAWVCGNSDKGVVNFATNVELGNSLNMYFAFWDPKNPKKDFLDWDSYSVVITHTDAKGDPVNSYTDIDGNPTNKIPLSHDRWYQTTVNGANACVVYCNELSATQIGDIITVELYVTGENEPIDTWSNSIQHYAMRMLSMHRDNETLRTLIVDMLNYGAECQKHFAAQAGTQIAVKDLVNARLSEKQRKWATMTVDWDSVSDENPGYEANLIVDGNIRFAIKGANDQWTYTFMNHWKTAERNGNFLENKTGEVYYYISKLYVADARQTITIIVDGKSYTDSVAAYCKRMKNESEVFTAFMKFSDAARAYLYDKENRV